MGRDGEPLATRFYGVSYTGKQYTKMTRKYTGDGRVIDNDKEVYVHYPGGYMQDSTYYFYVKDYQGNNVAVMDGKKNFIQRTDYYPYGEPWREPTGQPWLYSGNERLRLDGINEYDFNARRFNSVEGRFSSWDVMNEKYPWLSPYAYCGGDPVNAVDKTGKVIIFINGMHSGDGGSPKYWGGIDKLLQSKFKDYNTLYLDGANGGIRGLPWNLDLQNRYQSGYEYGFKKAEIILNHIEGKEETIKVVSHSMGSAYAKGLISGLYRYAFQNGLRIYVEWEVDIAPYQPEEQKAVSGVKTKTFSHWNDVVAGHHPVKSADNQRSNFKNLLLRPNRLLEGGVFREFIEGLNQHSINGFEEDIRNWKIER